MGTGFQLQAMRNKYQSKQPDAEFGLLLQSGTGRVADQATAALS